MLCSNSCTKVGDILLNLKFRLKLLYFNLVKKYDPLELQELYSKIDSMLDDSGYPKDFYYYQLNNRNDEK